VGGGSIKPRKFKKMIRVFLLRIILILRGLGGARISWVSSSFALGGSLALFIALFVVGL